MQAEMGIGSGAVEVRHGSAESPTAPASIHLYVDDAEATCQRALRAGAASIYPVGDHPSGDLQGAVKDQFGNLWYIARASGEWIPGPEGGPSGQPDLHLSGGQKRMPVVEAAVRATGVGVHKTAGGDVRRGGEGLGGRTAGEGGRRGGVVAGGGGKGWGGEVSC